MALNEPSVVIDKGLPDSASGIRATPNPSQSRSLNQAGKLESLYFGVLLFIGHALLLLFFLKDPWTRALYVMPLFLAAGLYLVCRRWQELLGEYSLEDFRPDQRKGAGLLGVAWLILSLATLIWSPWLGLVAALVALAGYACWVGGLVLLRCLAPLLVLLSLFLRPPVDLDFLFATELTSIQASWASILLDLLGLTNLCSGAIIEIPGQQISASLVSSGFRSQLLLSGFALAYGLWRRRPWWQLILLWMGGLLFLAIGDILLLTLSIISNLILHFNPLLGWGKLLVRVGNLAASVGLVISLDHLATALGGLFRKRHDYYGVKPKPILVMGLSASAPPAPAADESRATSQWPFLRQFLATMMRRPVHWQGWGLGLLFAFAGMIQLVWAPLVVNLKPTLPAALQTNLVINLPEQIGLWRQIAAPTNHPPPYRPSRTTQLTWTYQNGRIKAQITLSYPFEDFTPVTDPAPDTGWKIHKRQIYETDQTAEKQPYVEVQMIRPPGQSAALFYAYFTTQEEWLRPKIIRWIRSEFQFLDKPVVAFRTQVLANYYLTMQSSELENVRKLFLEARYYLALQVLNKTGDSP